MSILQAFVVTDFPDIATQASGTLSTSLIVASGGTVASPATIRVGRGSSIGKVKYFNKAFTPLGRPWPKR
jgi:hypothetical protein